LKAHEKTHLPKSERLTHHLHHLHNHHIHHHHQH
jgi:hypothetical protein